MRMADSGSLVSSAFVRIENVNLSYGAGIQDTLALENVSLDIEEGEFVAIVGPSGCGKSSLLKLISGLHPPKSGSVWVDGKLVSKPINICGIAFQNATMLPWRTTLENILLPLEVIDSYAKSFRSRKDEYRAMASALLKQVNLQGMEERYPWELSGGMQQRASLCRALIHNPRLLLLDEPFGALDAFTREDLWDIVQQLWINKRPTVILVTHDLREALFLADRIFVFSSRPGRVITEARVEFQRPRQLDEIVYSERFIHLLQSIRQQIKRA